MGKSQSSSPNKGFHWLRSLSANSLTYSDYVKTAITGNMELIDRLNSDIEKEREEAAAEAIAFVQEQSL